MSDENLVRFDGVCPLCGSKDGIVVKGKDGRYRNMCRVMFCQAMYKPLPPVGYDSAKDAHNPLESAVFKKGISVREYLGRI